MKSTYAFSLLTLALLAGIAHAEDHIDAVGNAFTATGQFATIVIVWPFSKLGQTLEGTSKISLDNGHFKEQALRFAAVEAAEYQSGDEMGLYLDAIVKANSDKKPEDVINTVLELAGDL